MAVGSGEIGIYGILRNDTTAGTLAKTDQVYDDNMAMYQEAINEQFQQDLENSSSDLEEKINQVASDLATEVTNRTNADTTLQNNIDLKINSSEKGSANGVAPLDDTGLISSQYLPSYVDDVLEYDSLSAFPSTGETGKIYVTLDTNLTYRWSGSTYVEISQSLALGETSSTAYPGDKGAATTTTVDSLPSTIVSSFTKAISNSPSASTVTVTVTDTVTQYTKSNGSYASGSTSPSGSTTLPAATTSAAGVMTATDKSNLDTAVSNISTIQSNITTIQSNISSLQSSVSSLENNLETEIQNREDEDASLQSQITQEISDRQSADTTLQNNITSEASTRSSADSNLQSQIDSLETSISSEVSNRTSADTNLQTQITTISEQLADIQALTTAEIDEICV